MVDFVQDRRRRLTTPQAPAMKVSGRVYLILSANFFAKRGKKMEPTAEFSDTVLQELSKRDNGDTYVVLYGDEAPASLLTALEAKKGTLDVRLFQLDAKQVGDTMLKLKKLLQDLGLKFSPVREIRTVSHINISKFVQGDRLVTIASDDYKKFGFDPDKELTFQDKVERRKRAAWV
jgi:hypothetical protein